MIRKNAGEEEKKTRQPYRKIITSCSTEATATFLYPTPPQNWVLTPRQAALTGHWTPLGKQCSKDIGHTAHCSRPAGAKCPS